MARGATSERRADAASEKRSLTAEVCSQQGGTVFPPRPPSYGDGTVRRIRTDPPGQGSKRLRALPAHRRAAGAAAPPGYGGTSRRAAFHDRPPVLGAVAEARLARGRGGSAPGRGPRPRRRAQAAAPGLALPPVHHRPARHARADVSLGVSG